MTHERRNVALKRKPGARLHVRECDWGQLMRRRVRCSCSAKKHCWAQAYEPTYFYKKENGVVRHNAQHNNRNWKKWRMEQRSGVWIDSIATIQQEDERDPTKKPEQNPE
jgi:hypothetical protein